MTDIQTNFNLVHNSVDHIRKTITPPTEKGQWYLVNFTASEFITFTSETSTYTNYMSLFIKFVDGDGDEVSRWNSDDGVRWVFEKDVNLIDCFTDVFGYRKYDHAIGLHDKTTFTTKECKKEYQDWLDKFERSIRRL